MENKGGRIAKTNAEYFTLPGHRTDELKAIKLEKGSEGVDIFLTVFEKICVSEYFVWNYKRKYKLRVFSAENNFEPDVFEQVINFMVEELELFDKVLYLNGYLFSKQFVEQFNAAGLFGQRKVKATDIYQHVEALIQPGSSMESEMEDGLPF